MLNHEVTRDRTVHTEKNRALISDYPNILKFIWAQDRESDGNLTLENLKAFEFTPMDVNSVDVEDKDDVIDSNTYFDYPNTISVSQLTSIERELSTLSNEHFYGLVANSNHEASNELCEFAEDMYFFYQV